jgi:hypothetical protein
MAVAVGRASEPGAIEDVNPPVLRAEGCCIGTKGGHGGPPLQMRGIKRVEMRQGMKAKSSGNGPTIGTSNNGPGPSGSIVTAPLVAKKIPI